MKSKQEANVARLYPEQGAGGFTQVDGTVNFYNRVNALLRPNFVVMDLGAGRGGLLQDDPDSYRSKLACIKGKVAKVVGVDVDESVLENPHLDEARIIRIGEPYPFPDKSFDLIVSDWVLEHVDNPEEFANEVARVLKPGGWFCARTPNRWGMIGMVSSLIPNRAHAPLLSSLQDGRLSEDVFPTRYLLNSIGMLKRAFDQDRWGHHSYFSNPEPPYIQRSLLAMRGVQFMWRFTPARFHTVLNVFLERKSRDSTDDAKKQVRR